MSLIVCNIKTNCRSSLRFLNQQTVIARRKLQSPVIILDYRLPLIDGRAQCIVQSVPDRNYYRVDEYHDDTCHGEK